jgi:4-methylaminobutanoate oxidase (formaldehyde-forming)
VNWIDRNGESGHTKADMVVNCGGMWGHEVGRMASVNVPLHACEHFYIVTEAIKGLTQMPVLRVPDECAYYKEDAGKYLLGAFEPNAKPWAMDGIPDNFEFDQLPEDFDHFEPILEAACKRLPMLAEAGIHRHSIRWWRGYGAGAVDGRRAKTVRSGRCGHQPHATVPRQ